MLRKWRNTSGRIILVLRKWRNTSGRIIEKGKNFPNAQTHSLFIEGATLWERPE
jgi:hypothetical protein